MILKQKLNYCWNWKLKYSVCKVCDSRKPASVFAINVFFALVALVNSVKYGTCQ